MKHERLIAFLTLFVSVASFIYALIYFANKSYPVVGHDFSYFVPRLIDSFIHYQVNGLSIQWYTPSFGGGLPAYPNPQHMQFTLVTLLMTFTGPWNAIWASTVFFIVAGFISAYFLFENICELDPLSSAIGAAIFNINGFVFSHAVVGHLGYQTFPLLPLILLVFFHKKIKPIHKGIVLTIILSINIHSGGFYVIIIYILTLLITTPLLLIIKPNIISRKDFLLTIMSTVLFTLMINGSKLYAVSSYMHWFPRKIEDDYSVNIFYGMFSIFLQLFGSTIFLTFKKNIEYEDLNVFLKYMEDSYGGKYGIWEFDIWVSLSALILVIVFLTLFIYNKKGEEKNIINILLIIAALFGFWLVTEFRLTKGLVYPYIRDFPFLRSLHVNLRFSSSYLLPISLFSALGFKFLQEKIKNNFFILSAFLIFSILTIAPLATYASFPVTIYQYIFDISKANSIYENAKKNEANFYIRSIAFVSDFDSFQQHSSSLLPYEPIFGYSLERFDLLAEVGDVENIKDGYFNMTNPASLVFPEENDLFLFERIKVTERDKFEQFINYQQPDWKRPLIQYLLDILMLLSTILILILCIGHLIKNWCNPKYVELD